MIMVSNNLNFSLKAAITVAFMFFCMNVNAQRKIASPEVPDFAFPENVEKVSASVLDKALDSGNGVEAMKALIQLVAARNIISPDSFVANIGVVDSVAERLEEPYPILCRLLKARMFTEFYRASQYEYDGRTLPLDSFPDDPRSWSRGLFAKKVYELVDSAVLKAGNYIASPLRSFSAILTNVKEGEANGLTLYDFIMYNGAESLSSFETFGRSGEEVIPFFGNQVQPASSSPFDCMALRKKIIDNVLLTREKTGDKLALAVAVVKASDLLDYEKRYHYLSGWLGKFSGSEAEGRILVSMCQPIAISEGKEKECAAVYGDMRRWLEKFPSSQFSKSVKSQMEKLEAKSASLTVERFSLPGHPVKGNLTVENQKTAYVLVYKIPENIVVMNSFNNRISPSGMKLVETIQVDCEGGIPFREEKTFESKALPAGIYLFIPSDVPRLPSDWRRSVRNWNTMVSVTDLAVFSVYNGKQSDSGLIYVVDAATQAPVRNASVSVYDDTGKKLLASGLTDASGSFKAPKGFNRVIAKKGNSIACMYSDIQYDTRRNQEARETVSILTDLPIYRPGEKVGFAAVAWKHESHKNSLIVNRELVFALMDANGNTVDTISARTDASGRCDGSFALPEEGLLGGWRIRSAMKDSKKTAGSAYFQVADYKTPTFIVELNADSAAVPENADSVRFKGKINTYSGMSLGDCDVSFDVRWQPWWRYWNPDARPASFGGVTRAAADGSFVITLPVTSLRKTYYEHGIFSVVATATSPAGETQSSNSLRFSLGRGLEIRPDIDPKTEVVSDTLKFNVPVYDMLGNPTVTSVDYTVSDRVSGKVMGKGVFESPCLTIPSETLLSGDYKFCFTLPSDTLKTEASTVVFRNSDTKVPCQSSVWIPAGEIICGDGQRVVVKAGSGFDGGWILFTLSNENGVISREWRLSGGDLLEFELTAPDSGSRLFASFTGMHDFNQMTEIVTLIPESQMRKLDVEVISFRDRISAGEKEDWKFRFTENGKPVAGLAALAVMNNKALNAIVSNRWSFVPGSGFWNYSTYVSGVSNHILNVFGSFSKSEGIVSLPQCVPGWETYGQQLAGFARYRRFMATRSMKRENGMSVMEEADDGVVVMESVENQMMMKSMATADMAMDLAESEVETVAGTGGAEPKADIPLRPVDLPLAFFMPSLKSDAEGIVTLSFTTPDFNTTWQTQVIGYTQDLLTASLIRDAVASKPVMVQTNMPRFVRTGDRASVSALLFNNTPENLPLEGDIEVFDPMTGRVIASFHEKASPVAPSGNKVISVEFDVPSDLSSLAVRAYARSGKSADGEQDLFPVLPSSTPVVESTTFYLGQGPADYDGKLPKYRKDASVMLKYCSNPLWECVLALPSLSDPESKNLLSLLRALYADCMAGGLMEKYPEIRKGVLAMTEIPDSLESPLLKDQGFKTVALGNTPWVNNAASETARMRSLSRLSDQKTVEATVDRIVTEILALQNADGGWGWCPQMRSSEFMTMRALSTMGELKRNACLPASLSRSVLRGIDYCDRQILENAKKAGANFSYLGMADYLYIRSFFNAGDGPAGFRALKEKALDKISSSWKEMSLEGKSKAAILLWREGGRIGSGKIASICHEILESLSQFASKDPSKGWWFASRPSLGAAASVLSAFAEIEPASDAVDGLRQWLVLQKETQDWGTETETVAVVQAIVASGSNWTPTSLPRITLNGKPLEIPATEIPVGMVTVQLEPSAISGAKIRISKDSSVPAWGGVISQYVLPIKDVKNERCENLKVEKQYLLLSSDADGVKTRKSNRFKVGDLVRVVLTVTCDKAMDYVALIDERAACLEPVGQLSGFELIDGVPAYRETRDTRTSLFISSLAKGVNVFSYDCRIDRDGVYSTGIATVQSQYSPLQTAHSAGETIRVE